jgi:hypothetical protein
VLASGTVLGNTIISNEHFGIKVYYDGPVGYGNNTLAKNSGGPQVLGASAFPLQPNLCKPACQ